MHFNLVALLFYDQKYLAVMIGIGSIMVLTLKEINRIEDN